MDTIEITIQRKSGAGWPVIVEQRRTGDFIPKRKEGWLQLDEMELQEQTTPRDYGIVLGQALFRDHIRDAFAHAAATSPDRLRVLLFVETDDLRSYRWERLCAPIDGQWDFLILNQRTLFSLYLPSITDRNFPLIGRSDLRALIVVASPNGLDRYGLAHFDAATTAERVHRALGPIPSDLLAHVDGAVGPPTLDAFCARLIAEQYTMVHVVCHGQFSRRSGETSIFLADAENRVDRVGAERLMQRLRQLHGIRGLPHFGFLATCDGANPEAEGALGSIGQRLVRDLGVPTVIAMTDKVSIETAQLLTEGFYFRLQQHGEVDRALVETMGVLGERPDMTVPALYSRLGARPLFSDSVTHILTQSELQYGLTRLEEALAVRSPILLAKFYHDTERLRQHLDNGALAQNTSLQEDHTQVLAELEDLALSVLDIGYRNLCLGEEPPGYDARCPFRGLFAFQPEDQALFFGRETLIERLHVRLFEHNFLAILGASGSGKSSLVLAGLIPLLRQDDPQRAIASMTPGRSPLSTFRNTIAQVFEDNADSVLLFIDQFEELFTLCRDPKERGAFVEELMTLMEQPARSATLPVMTSERRAVRQEAHRALAAPDHDSALDHPLHRHGGVPALSYPAASHRNNGYERILPPVLIIVAMRADFWGECAAFPQLKQAMLEHQELIDVMQIPDLRRAIEQQAASVGLRFETDLCNTILDDIQGEPGAMPLLQHTLLESWKRRHGRWLRTDEYRKLGGVQQAIARTADELYAQLSPNQQERAQDLFVRLTRLDDEANEEGKQRDTRRRVPIVELIPAEDDANETRSLLALLADAKLIVTSIEWVTQHETAEVAHESLIRYWPRLRTWLDMDRTLYRLRQSVSQAARAWQASAQDDDLLVHRGGQLDDAWRLAQRAGFLMAFELDYINACMALRRREHRREVEAARQLAAAAEAQRAAEEQARHEAEQRASDRARAVARLRRRAVALACAGLVALVAAIGAGLSWQAASAERNQALSNESRLLTNLARQQLWQDPVASLQLSLRALSNPAKPRPYVPEAEFILTQALRSSLERIYLPTADALNTPAQIALADLQIAVGHDAVHLISADLQRAVALSGHTQEILGVAWGYEGVLLSHDVRDVRIWRNGEVIAAHTFASDVACAVWRPGHVQMAICSGAGLWFWPDIGQPPQILHSFTGTLRAVRWSQDGRRLAAWDSDQNLLIWDANEEKLILRVEAAHEDRLWSAVWSRDSRYLVTTDGDGKVYIWKSGTTQPNTLTASELDVTDALFVDATRFLTWGYDGVVRLWTVDGLLVREFDPAFNVAVRGVTLADDATQLLTYYDEGLAYIWALDTGEVQTELRGHQAGILAGAWFYNYVATSSKDGTIRIWSALTGEELMTLRGHTGNGASEYANVWGIHWRPDGHLLTYGEDGSLRLWQVFDEQGLPLCAGVDDDGWPRCFGLSRAYQGHEGDVWFARWLQDDTIVSSGYDGTARRWSLTTNEQTFLPNPSSEWREIVWRPDGQQVLTYVSEQYADTATQNGLIWEIETQQLVAEIPGPIATAFWLDETRLIVSQESGAMMVVDPTLGIIHQHLDGHTARVNDVQLFDRTLATGSNDGTIRIWHEETGEQLAQLGHTDPELPILSVEWGQGGRRLLSTGFTVTMWDLTTLSALWSADDAGFNVSATFSPDEGTVAAAIEERFYLLNADTGRPTWQNLDHRQPVAGIQWVQGAGWNGDESRLLLLTWSGDGTARLWDVNTQTEVLRVADTGPIDVAALSSDGSLLLTAGYSGILRIWQVWPRSAQNLLTTAQTYITRPLSTKQQQAFFLTDGLDPPTKGDGVLSAQVSQN